MIDFVWWVGVVENRDDPERLGRCKVRIFGYHTEDKNLLPTEDLPWATPIQPITSASISGIGATPVGIVPGTWVTGWFLDGKEAQQPIIFGTIPGKPGIKKEAAEKKKQDLTKVNVLKDGTGLPIYEHTGNLIFKSAVTTSLRNSFTPLIPADIDKLFNALATKLSSNSLNKVGEQGELGKYQITVKALIQLGYVSLPFVGTVDKTLLDDATYWTGLNNIKSKQEFLSSGLIQEEAMLKLTKYNYDNLISLNKITEQDDKTIVSGFLSSAHVFGIAGSDDFERKDIYGRQAKDFFTLGVTALGGTTETVRKNYESADNYLPERNNGTITNEDLAKSEGFSDPDKKYPKYEYQGLSDINKLAVSDKSHLSFKVKKAQRTENIQLARSAGTWSEPETAYKATYPYNQVFETEAGHVIELDSTPNAERIQIFHKKGTYIEIDVNGTMVRKVLGDNYEVLDRNNFLYVKGAQNLTVEGKTLIYVKDDAAIEVDGDVSVTGHKDAFVRVANNMALAAKNIVMSGKDSVNIISEGPINLQSSKEVNMKSGSSIAMDAAGSMSLNAGINLSMNALLIKSQMGANKVSQLPVQNFPIPDARGPNKTSIPPYQRNEFFEEDFIYDAVEPEAIEWNDYRANEGQISNSVDIDLLLPNAEDLAPNLIRTAGRESSLVRVPCDVCDQFGGVFPKSFKLSKNFTIQDVVVGNQAPPTIVAQYGLSAKDIVCNLMQLAENVLEPLRKQFPGLQVTSSLRRDNIPNNSRPGTFVRQADHGIGGAVDIVWPRINIKTSAYEYLEITEWCKTNIPFRQLLFELSTNSDGSLRGVWVHIALLLDANGNIQQHPSPIGTLKDHKGFKAGIAKPLTGT